MQHTSAVGLLYNLGTLHVQTIHFINEIYYSFDKDYIEHCDPVNASAC